MAETEAEVGTKADSSALFLSPEMPYPLAGGGALRAASLITYLARHHAVDVIVFREPYAEDPRRSFPAGLARSISVLDLPRNGRSQPARAARNLGRMLRGVPPLVDRFSGFSDQIARLVRGKRYDLAVVEHFWCAPYLPQLAAVAANTVLDLHNIESVLHERCGRAEGALTHAAHDVFRRACLSLERRWYPRFSLLLVTSESDAERVRRIVPDAHVAVYPNALPARPIPKRIEEHTIVFSGNLEYGPNVSAVRYFRRKIWPALRERWPDLRWRLVGKNPAGVSRFTAGDDRIEVTGPVPDAVQELSRAKAAVVPLLAGSGTRFKILEAWAAATPVVSTSLGAEGLSARHQQHLLIADKPDDFIAAVSDLLGSVETRRRIGRAGRDLFEKEFTWEAAWNKLHL